MNKILIGVVCLLLNSNCNGQNIYTIAGDYSLGIGYSGDEGSATHAQLNAPEYIALDNSGNLYIADQGNNRIRVVNAITRIITTFAGNGYMGASLAGGGYSGDGAAATAAEFNHPTGVAVDATGNVYVSDAFNNVIRKINTSGIITTYAGFDSLGYGVAGYTGDGGSATNAKLNMPFGIAFDRFGNLYIAEYGNNIIRKVAASTGIISTVAGKIGITGYSGDGGPATAAQFSEPYDVAVDDTENIYIADFGNNRIRKVNTTGIISTFAGGGPGVSGTWGDGAPATTAWFINPMGVKLDGTGNVYITGSVGDIILKVTATTGIINAIAGFSTSGYSGSGYSGDGGPAVLAQLRSPVGVVVDGSENVYISDWGNGVIREIGYHLLGVPNVAKDNKIKIYPNPASTEITITSLNKITQLEINNTLGQTVYRQECNTENLKINVENLSVGVYYFKVNGSIYEEFIKN